MGAFASGLCIIHCLATPLIFVAQACSISCCADAPGWWVWMDYGFLFIAALAIRMSMRNTTSQWVKFGFIACWVSLATLIVGKTEFSWSIPQYMVYLPALGLIAVHVVNLKYCQCTEDTCCTETAVS